MQKALRLLFVFIPILAFSNSHEHLSYLPSYEDIVKTLAEASDVAENKKLRAYTVEGAEKRVLNFEGGLTRAFINFLVYDPTREEFKNLFGQDYERNLVKSFKDELQTEYNERRKTGRQEKKKEKHFSYLQENLDAYLKGDIDLDQTVKKTIFRNLFSRLSNKESLNDVFKSLGFDESNSAMIFRNIFEINESSKSIFGTITTARNGVFKFLDNYTLNGKNMVSRPFLHYARRTPLAQRSYLDVSFNISELNQAFRPENLVLIADRLNQTKSKFFYSLTRNFFGKKDNVTSYISRHSNIITGIDISGSIKEIAADNIRSSTGAIEQSKVESINVYKKGFREIFTNNDLREIRIHAFEGASKGLFYRALWGELNSIAKDSTIKKIPKIRIGHINSVDSKTLRGLKAIGKKFEASGKSLDIEFEASYTSNSRLHGARPLYFLDKVTEIYNAGFKVSLGTDGAGIFKTTIIDQLIELDQFVAKDQMDAFRSIIRNTGITQEAWRDYLSKNKVPFSLCMSFDAANAGDKCEAHKIYETSLKYCK